MFTQHCLIRKNTSELREKLEKDFGLELINYHNRVLDSYNNKSIEEGRILVTYYENYYGIAYNTDQIIENGRIDCGTNEELFLAISSLRDDSDKNQWFTDGSEDFWFKLGDDKIDETKEYYEKEYGIIIYKATVEELIEHFKSTNND